MDPKPAVDLEDLGSMSKKKKKEDRFLGPEASISEFDSGAYIGVFLTGSPLNVTQPSRLASILELLNLFPLLIHCFHKW